MKILGHVISSERIQPIAKRVKDPKNLKSTDCKRDVTNVRRCLGFSSCYIKNLHVDSKPFYNLITDSTSFQWTEEHEKIFHMIKDRIMEDTILAIPSTEYLFKILVDSSNAGTGYMLIQQFPDRNGSYPSILEFLIKQNRKCQHSTLNCVGMSQICKHMRILIFDLLFLYICIVTINPSSIYGDANDSYPTAAYIRL